MGKDKVEKKRLKAQVKAEKARIKAGDDPASPSQQAHPNPWYKDPNWVRVIIALATLIVTILALVLTLG